MSLKEYRLKRDFKKTAEPSGAGLKVPAGHRFVVQKHAASRLHYDFRLELEGTLKSWALPKGPPYAKGEKRLAVHVEDHPISYIDFEGTIPKGQYGGGTVMVWDRGTFEPLSESPAKDLEAGKLHFILSGTKLKGEWYLVRLRAGDQWLMIRGKEDMKPLSAKMDDQSALSGQTMSQLAQGGNVWQSNRSQPQTSKAKAPKKKPSAPGGPPAKEKFEFIEPMKARLVAEPPPGDWLYEIKLDGFRTMAFKKGGEIKLLSRNEKDFCEKFPEVADGMAKLKASDIILDGEVVALDEKGRSSFQLLQAYNMGRERPPIFFYAFDLLRFEGKDLRDEPIQARKEKLRQLLQKPPDSLRFSPSIEGPVTELMEQARQLGLEGLIGKRKDSHYEAGQRSGAWIKLKLHQAQEMVIGGHTDPEGKRQHFGALLVGYQDGGGLRFAGKVGAGFNEAFLRDLHARFHDLETKVCPFHNLPEKREGRFGKGLTAGAMKSCHWVEPKLVCQVKFSEWTKEGKLRQPVFLGLREDKQAAEVVREIPV